MLQTIFDENIRTLVKENIDNCKILLAVSGGIDSMCMATLFLHSHLNLKFGVAHVNFQLRGEDSVKDQQLVEDWAKEHNVEFFSTRFETKQYAKQNSISTQMAARELRYDWFAQLMNENHYDLLSVAHNQDDSVETMFLNLLRGTGVKGLTGIKKVNGNIIRPILNISRKSISEYVEQKGVRYRDDKTNFESHYSRNRLRNIIFPEFKKINPSFLNTITRNTSYLNQVAEVLEDLYKSKEGTLFENKGDETTIIIDELKKERHPSFWLFSILEQKGFNSSQLSQVLLAIDGQSGKVFISSTHQLVIDRGEIKVYPIENESDYILSITEPGFYSFKGISFKLDLFVPDEDFKPIPQYGELYFDAEKIKFPIVCRSWKAADRFRPFGMEKGFKKISDFYTDIKYSMREKNRQPILFDGEEIICLPGLRSDNRYRVTKKTRIIGEISELNYSPQS